MTENTADRFFPRAPGQVAMPLLSRLLPAVGLYAVIVAVAALAFFLPDATDYLGSDNDDVMRLVEIRDFLGGQNWFDLTQYRLGLEGGTLMHWSRLIDLPIALLIRLFSLFLTPDKAEAVVVTVWPLLLVPLLLLPLGLAVRRLAGVAAMHIALGLGAFFVLGCVRFKPGSIDHHNVQLMLVMWIAAMLVDPQRRASSYVVAAIACALALAIGVETTPFVAVVCVCVALQWVWHGQPFSRPARSFGLSLALSVSAVFFLTIPPRAYAVVTCDNFSLGFYALSALGGAALFLLASLPKQPSRLVRVGLAGITGGLILLTARIIAPQCLGDPLGTLDPLLVELWLNGVTEARSFLAETRLEPEMVGGFYAVGLFAMVVCLVRSLRREETELHLVLLALIGASWGIALLQVRGAFFSNMLAILPLSLLISDLRRASAANPENPSTAFAYISTVLMSVPVVWALGGVLAVHGWKQAADMRTLSRAGISDGEVGECGDPADMMALNALPTGVIVAPSNSGADILRFTPHRVLSGPYHRNQKGMLTELYIGMAQPGEAKAFLRGAEVTALAFCKTDPQTDALIRRKPDGLYANLARGQVPDYLQPFGQPNADGFRLYKVLPDRN
ncbi:hypothetical protein PMI07_003850 [Rhizobium sp. CF080]|uniref:hypothetical protein n=1 Tax=Rhizobium sp. (strain CF080) TaxID=1144310 RepID=UPI0003E7FC9D|nr:hypothetical protein [Rhizobium sp. CF080]EUC00564.1 hypothetical protein PMI07_003850 [Rhizobium sp. CF080]